MKGDKDRARAEQFQRLVERVDLVQQDVQKLGFQGVLQCLDVSKDRKISCPGELSVYMPATQKMAEILVTLRSDLSKDEVVSIQKRQHIRLAFEELKVLRWEQIEKWCPLLADMLEDRGIRHLRILGSTEAMVPAEHLHLDQWKGQSLFTWKSSIIDVLTPPLKPQAWLVRAADHILKVMEEVGPISAARMIREAQSVHPKVTSKTWIRYLVGDIVPGELEGHLWVRTDGGRGEVHFRSVLSARKLLEPWLTP